MKESLFDIIARCLKGARVLDLCAGSGSLGLEALSRGAVSVLFVESLRSNVNVIHENISALNVADRATVVAGELPYVLSRVRGKFDVIFLDAPFAGDLVDRTLPRLASKNHLKPDGLLIVQRDRRSTEIKAKGLNVHRRHRIGDSELWFFQVGPIPEGEKEGEEPVAVRGKEEEE